MGRQVVGRFARSFLTQSKQTMSLETFLQILIPIHAALGGLALVAGLAAIGLRKGSDAHRRSGRVFYYAMFGSILSSLLVAVLPGHYSVFLFAIGLFSLYFLVLGKRAIRYPMPGHSFAADRLWHRLMLAVGVAMMGASIWLFEGLQLVLLVFGAVGVGFALTNLNSLKNEADVRQRWLALHIRHIAGAYIAAVTAFFVVNGVLPGLANWFAPGLVGGLLITRAIRRLAQRATLLVLLGLAFGNAQAQSEFTPENTRLIGVKVGLTHTRLQDGRLSGSMVSKWSPKYALSIERRSDKVWSESAWSFTRVNRAKADDFFRISSFYGQFRYAYRRKVGEGLWLGGQTSHQTLLNLPRSRVSLFTNNPISYTLVQSLGPSLAYSTRVGDQFTASAKLETPIVAYLIQPIYGHPYPAAYMKEGVFSPTRSGMAWPMIKSGKVVGLKRFRNLNIVVGLDYLLSSRFSIGLEYHAEMLYANANGKAVRWDAQDLLLRAFWRY